VNAIVFGGTGMVGQGVLRECLLDPEILHVLSIVRSAGGQKHPKLRELEHANFFDFSPIESELAGFDAAFFCLGATSAGKTEAEYSRVTYDITMAVGEPLARLNPDMTFVFVSGAGTDSTERGRSMWARVKGKTENGLMRANWPRDDRSRQIRRTEVRARKRGHQQASRGFATVTLVIRVPRGSARS
jgi:uncharacterized protein YbjT (DUF2867 family)